MKRLAWTAPMLLAIAAQLTVVAPTVHAADFYAYYTKIDSGEAWEQYSLTGDHADVVVRIGDVGELVFWRASSYLPLWRGANEIRYLDEIVARAADGPEQRPDRINQYSYVRIIENSPKKVVIHWRYMANFNPQPDLSVTRPDFGDVGFDGVVHETFTITPNGAVTRAIRQGQARLDDFNDAGNASVQELKLSADGIEEIRLQEAQFSGVPAESIEGAPVKPNVAEGLALHFTFDEGLNPRGDVARDAVSGAVATVNGNKSVWKRGVSGTALGFDGYASKVVLLQDAAPAPGEALTVEAWVAPGAYSVCKWSGIELTDWRWDNKPTGTNSTCEHMMDRQCRFGHVRIIENTDARVVVHWRYASCDTNYKHPNWDRTNGWGVWNDEYYTIYPDGTSIRHVDSNGATDHYFDPPSSIHFSAPQLFFQAGTTPQDNLQEQAVTLANLAGETVHADLATGELDRELEAPLIATINLKSEYKVFLGFKPLDEGVTWMGGWERPEMQDPETQDPETQEVEEENDGEQEGEAQTEWELEVARWADSWRAVGLEPQRGEGLAEADFVDDSELLTGPWNHWPASQFLADGRNCTATDRLSSAEFNVTAGGDRSSEIMYGLTKQDITELIPRVKAWCFPAAVTDNGRVRKHGFDQGQCAYVFTALSDSFYFTLQGTQERPIHNPCFVIKNWRSANATARLTIDGEQVRPGREFRQGTFYDTNAAATCVIWLRYNATDSRIFAINQD